MSNSPLQVRSSTGDSPLGLSRLAKRLRRRSLDLIAIGAVSSLCLASGQTLTQWWSSTAGRPPVATPVTEPASGALPDLWSLEFGDLPLRITHQETAGDLPAVWAKLLELCRATLETLPANDRLTRAGVPQVARVLERLQNLTPFQRITGLGDVFRLEGALPTMVAVRTGATTPPQSHRSPGELACWAMAVPGAGSQWRLYVFEPSAAERAGSASTARLLPDDARRILCLNDPDGTHLEAFTVPAELGDGAGQLRRHLLGAGWRIVRQQREPLSWTAQFEQDVGDETRRCLVHVHTNGNGAVRGLMTLPGRASGLSTRGAQ